MEKAVSGHGVFIYDAEATIARYGSPALVALAAKECQMQHAWVRIHGAATPSPATPTLNLIAALKQAEIAVAGWGWCQGDNIELEAELALTALNEFGLQHYIADVEDGVHGANWTQAEVRSFFKSLREALPNSQIGLSTFGFIPWHKPQLMTAAQPFVDFFAPQTYWFNFPTQKILKAAEVDASKYPLNNPASYVRLCIEVWKKVVEKPLVITGQAYWGEVPGFTQGTADAKLTEFIDEFDAWKNIQGLNWWHLGGKSQAAMSFAMFQKVRSAKLNDRF
ncbi:MAG TPA: hypothetical protein VI306_00510 [Pyrinomonadaceae bacterium]